MSLHCRDYERALDDAGMKESTMGIEPWLEQHGLCSNCVAHYASSTVKEALAANVNLAEQLDGIFVSGLVLGLALCGRVPAGTSF